MASGQSGNDHARNPPKTESLRVPVFWHHIPQTWVSFFFVVVTYRDTVAREPRCEICCDSQARFRGEKHFRGNIRLPSDLRVKHEDEKLKPGVFKHVRIIASSKCTAIAWRGVLCVKKIAGLFSFQRTVRSIGVYHRSLFNSPPGTPALLQRII